MKVYLVSIYSNESYEQDQTLQTWCATMKEAKRVAQEMETYLRKTEPELVERPRAFEDDPNYELYEFVAQIVPYSFPVAGPQKVVCSILNQAMARHGDVYVSAWAPGGSHDPRMAKPHNKTPRTLQPIEPLTGRP